jgi:Nif-specific regulatory protein
MVLADDRAVAGGPRTAPVRHAYGLTAEEVTRGVFAWGEGITGRVLASGLPAIVQDVDTEPLFLFRTVRRAQLPSETVAFIALPIAVNGTTVGVLGCHRIRSRQRHLNDDLALLRILATLAGQLLQLEQLVAEQTRQLEARNEALSRALDTRTARYGLIGSSPALLEALGELERVSQSQATVLLLGDSGTGKELFARAVHLASGRRAQPFIKVNCSAIPETLFESELFGHERSAFTAAAAARQAAAHAARGHAGARGRRARDSNRCASGGRHQPRPGPRSAIRALPPRPVLPPQRHPNPPAQPARAARRRASPCPAFREPRQPGPPAQRLSRTRRLGAARSPRLARQHPRAG